MSRSRQPCDFESWRAATSLVELLVVIGILGTLISLLIPAVQQVRAASLRTACLNNSKQLALAVHAFHGVHGRLPTGISVESGQAAQPFLSWQARLLPYLEREQLWAEILAAYEVDKDYRRIPPHIRRAEIISAFGCPADGRSFTGSTLLPIKLGFTSYLGVAGVLGRKPDGVLFADSLLKLQDIADGTSTTLLAGERPPSSDEQAGWWYAGHGQDRKGTLDAVMGVREQNVAYNECDKGPYRYGPGSFDNLCDAFHFWSPHPGGAHFAFCDGSVRFLSYSADPILPALATRAGGEAVQIPE